MRFVASDSSRRAASACRISSTSTGGRLSYGLRLKPQPKFPSGGDSNPPRKNRFFSNSSLARRSISTKFLRKVRDDDTHPMQQTAWRCDPSFGSYGRKTRRAATPTCRQMLPAFGVAATPTGALYVGASVQRWCWRVPDRTSLTRRSGLSPSRWPAARLHKLHVDADACAGPDGEHERVSVVLRTVVGIGGGRWPFGGQPFPEGRAARVGVGGR